MNRVEVLKALTFPMDMVNKPRLYGNETTISYIIFISKLAVMLTTAICYALIHIATEIRKAAPIDHTE